MREERELPEGKNSSHYAGQVKISPNSDPEWKRETKETIKKTVYQLMYHHQGTEYNHYNVRILHSIFPVVLPSCCHECCSSQLRTFMEIQ